MLDRTIKSTCKDAAKKLTGYRKREFTAKVTEDYFAGSARQAEIALGWCRHSIQLGLDERRTGIRCEDNYQARGRRKSESKSPNLGIDIKTLVDTQAQKAKVKVGNLSRGGKARTIAAKVADDHDTEWQSVLVPFGILNTENDQLSIYLGESAETSDFAESFRSGNPTMETTQAIVDCLTNWWQEHQVKYHYLEELVIDLDGGAATRSNRTQFIKRMVEFSQKVGLRIRLIYYPPYHSKYNPIERCWAALEQYWNGTILDSVEVALKWASNMTWKGIKPLVYQVTTIYEKGIKVLPKQLKQYQHYWQRSETLAQWDITITPG